MELHLRVALWMVFFLGRLQAKPVTSARQGSAAAFRINIDDLRLDLLLASVTCDPSVNFTSPSDVPRHCYAAALKVFRDGLEHASQSCTVEDQRADDTAEALDPEYKITEPPANSTDCQWEKKRFEQFVDDIEMFAQRVNSDDPEK